MATKKPKYLKEVKSIINKMKRNKFSQTMIDKVMNGKTLEQLAKSISSLTGMQKRYERQKEQPKLKKASEAITKKMRENVIQREINKNIKNLNNNMPAPLKRRIEGVLGTNYTQKQLKEFINSEWAIITSRLEELTGKNNKNMEDFIYNIKKNVAHRLDIIDAIDEVISLFSMRYGQFIKDSRDNDEIMESISQQIQTRIYSEVSKHININFENKIPYTRIIDLMTEDERVNKYSNKNERRRF